MGWGDNFGPRKLIAIVCVDSSSRNRCACQNGGYNI